MRRSKKILLPNLPKLLLARFEPITSLLVYMRGFNTMMNDVVEIKSI